MDAGCLALANVWTAGMRIAEEKEDKERSESDRSIVFSFGIFNY